VKWFKQIKEAKARKERPKEKQSEPEEVSRPPTLTLLYPPPTDSARVKALTPRERQVFDALLAGKKQREIAEMLGVKPTTVSFHCTALYKKLDIHDKAHLFLRYARFRTEPYGTREQL